MACYCYEGKVTYINVKGRGPNSAQLLFTIEASKSDNKPFVVNAHPATEPQVFSSIAALLLLAYETGKSVGVSYELADPTDIAFEIWLPVGGKSAEKRLPKKDK